MCAPIGKFRCTIGKFVVFVHLVKINQETMTVVEDDAIDEDEVTVRSPGLYILCCMLPNMA